MKKFKLFATSFVIVVGLVLSGSIDGNSDDKCKDGAIDADIYAPAWCVAGGLGCKICPPKNQQ